MKGKTQYTANQDIRQYMQDHGVSQKALGAGFGLSQMTICRLLQTELSDKEKEKWLNMIDSIATEANKRFAEEVLADEPHEEEEIDTTVSTKFQIGDRVKIPSKEESIAVVSDIWSSLAQEKTLYEVTHESNGTKGLYAENQLEHAPLPTSYSWEAHIDGNVAIVTMHAKQGEKEWIYARGHAHIIHDGEVGMAQAVSYAARRMFESLDKKQENKIYVK